MGFWLGDFATPTPENDEALGGSSGPMGVTSDWVDPWANYGDFLDNAFESISYEPIVSFWNEDAAQMFYKIVGDWTNSFLAVIGVVTNLITIVVFAKMGYKESANITMSAISFWELLKSLVLAYLATYDELGYIVSDFYTSQVIYVSSRYFTKIYSITLHTSGILAAYVAIERCLCVSMPFTARYLLTRKTASVICLSISIIVFALFSVYFYVDTVTLTKLGGYIFHTRPEMLSQFFERYLSAINMICPIATLTITSVSTIIIVYHLKKSSKFRSENKKGGSKQMSTRERKTTKMLVIIVLFYILYLLPWMGYHGIFTILQMAGIATEFTVSNLELVIDILVMCLSLISSCVNIFIFYFMSSEFKLTFRKIFHLPLQAKTSARK